MAVTPYKTFAALEVLTASDLNNSFLQITNGGQNLAWPSTQAKDLDATELILDADADSSLTADTDDRLDVKLNGFDAFRFDGSVSSPVNGIDFASKATGTNPTLTARGDANLGINLVPTGTGVVQVGGKTVGAEIISSGTVSAAATLDITDLLAVYRTYILAFDNLAPATDITEFRMRTDANNGASFEAGASDYGWNLLTNHSANTHYGSNDQADNEIVLLDACGNAANETASGQIVIHNPMDSSVYTHVTWLIAHIDNSTALYQYVGAGARLAAQADNAIRFLFSSGNITSMNWTLYGMRKS